MAAEINMKNNLAFLAQQCPINLVSKNSDRLILPLCKDVYLIFSRPEKSNVASSECIANTHCIL
ncbi:hypothetical protein DDB_G0290951 [Dictyostelium discoideum AX4]|uniref:hypothetical protein n=1 Tax=Dictyostelium discoideum AX4 TaxID=352472 RepID=UPI00004E4474|nr:hypothetical protein DDB_G0290951 [Dictyostelium discoideum AX4]EAL61991.1 hypothetical protein DDB_G0290951 [Dictyostelium discoideum AX4]|eukprot:XP_635491.1 hypothetical protein DDB_G0290951 [Dictyostelium discoideum AX4]